MKKKLFSKIISLTLATVSAFSLIACGGNGGGAGDQSIYNYEYHNSSDFRTHEVSVKETEEFFIKDGVSEYKVVYPAKADGDDLFAYGELVDLVEEATGVRLEVVVDTGLTYSDSNKYIVLSKNNVIYQDAGFNLNTSGLRNRGYYIKTKGNSLFIVGHKGLGVLNGVYGFLQYMFGYDYFYSNVHTIRDMVGQDVPFLTMDVHDVPDLKFNTAHYGEIFNDPVNAKRLRMVTYPEINMAFGGEQGHNTFLVVPKATYQEAHPLWYSKNCEQLCFSAGGDPDEYQALLNLVATEMLATVAKSNLEAIAFSPQDNTQWCACDACKDYIGKHYNKNASTYIRFMNDLAEIVIPQYEEMFPERDLKILLSAYHGTVTAPSAYDESKKEWVTTADMVLHPNVAVYFAPYHQANFYVPYNTAENQLGWDIIEGWKPLSDTFYLWFYTCYFGDYTLPFDSMTNMQATLQYLIDDCHVESFMNQGQYNCRTSDWAGLKHYMQAKLGWDCYYNREKILEDYFNGMYGPAASIMREYYDNYTLYMRYIHGAFNINGSTEVQGDISEAKVWTEGLITEWLEFCEDAHKAIQVVQYADEALFNQYTDNILLEEMMPAILLCHFQPSLKNEVDLAEYKQFILSVCKRLNLYGSTGESGGQLSNILG